MKFNFYALIFSLFSIFTFSKNLASQHSVAREWNEAILYSISKDFARPTVHARNLFHLSIAMYDSWAVYEEGAQTYLIGKNLYGYTAPFQGTPVSADKVAAQEEAISFAAYRLIAHRYANSPGLFLIVDSIQNLMDSKGFNYNNASLDYVNGGPAEMGNYIANQIISYGYTDGANEGGNYANTYYNTANPPIEVELPGNPNIIFPDRWQQITLTQAIDQAGQPVANTPPFLSPEWGKVNPFSMNGADKTILNRDGDDYSIYFDPGAPAYFDPLSNDGIDDPYKWNHLLVSIWASHLTTDDGVIWDASPRSIGNITSYPNNQEEMVQFYNLFEGGDPGEGYDVNPITGQPYETQMVKRGDYARVLAEFWADGPNSVTPPGHWFDILNHVTDHPLFERKWMGIGPDLSKLEYDVKSYLAMGGAMHDAAISAWGLKGYYDYIRPVSAIRFLVDNGQCTDPALPNYNLGGAPLVPGYIEMVEVGDPLAGEANEHVGKVKLYTWKGPDYIENPDTDIANVGWILGENWWPYQRPSFVTPPFAGYVSGHSTYSRTAAELMTLLTGSEYFPGGMSNFIAEQNEFLVFEEGPTETIELQWAKYNDASDQCSLSRIWGGIHPPIDDIPGRKIGMELGPNAFLFADSLVNGSAPYIQSITFSDDTLSTVDNGNTLTMDITFSEEMDTDFFPVISFFSDDPTVSALEFISADWTSSFEYQFTYLFSGANIELENINFGLSQAKSENGKNQIPYAIQNALYIDNKAPSINNITTSHSIVSDVAVAGGEAHLTFEFNENCDASGTPTIILQNDTDITGSLAHNANSSYWENGNTYVAVFDLTDENITVAGIDVTIDSITDNYGNPLLAVTEPDLFSIDTRNPSHTSLTINDPILNQQDQGGLALLITLSFDEEMDTSELPFLSFYNDNPLTSSLSLNLLSTSWISNTECEIAYDLTDANEELLDIGVSLQNFVDLNGNPGNSELGNTWFLIDTKTPEISNISTSTNIIADANIGSEGFTIEILYSENMNETQVPLVSISGLDIANSLQYQIANSQWINGTTYQAHFLVSDLNIEVNELTFDIDFASDAQGNNQAPFEMVSNTSLDTRNPVVLSVSASTYDITNEEIGEEGFNIVMIFDEEMDQTVLPSFAFTPGEPANSVFSINGFLSYWLNPFTYKAVFDVADVESAYEENLTINITEGADFAGNSFDNAKLLEFLTINMGTVGISEYINQNSIHLFPNPVDSDSEISLKTTRDETNVSIKIFDTKGRLFKSYHFDYLPKGTAQLPLKSIGSGIYLFSFQSEKSFSTSSVVIK